MKIELESPYKEDWRFGYVVTNPEGRETLILFNSSANRSSTQYARYLLAVKLGRYLTPYEQVDHIDDNKFNNNTDNLQVLTQLENIRKTFKTGTTMVKFTCPICGEDFSVPTQQSHRKEPCCSRKCGYIKTSRALKGRKYKR